MNAVAGTNSRPGIVSLISVWLWAIGLFNLLAGVAIIISRNNEKTIAQLGGVEPNIVLVAGISELVVGFLIVLSAIMLARGSSGARLFIAILMVGRIVMTGIAVAGGWGGANVLLAGVIHVLLPFAVLWALYGNHQADDWFRQA